MADYVDLGRVELAEDTYVEITAVRRDAGPLVEQMHVTGNSGDLTRFDLDQARQMRDLWTAAVSVAEGKPQPVPPTAEQLDKRAAIIAGVREYIDYVEAHPDLPIDDMTFRTLWHVRVERGLEGDEKQEAAFDELRRIARVLDVEADLRDAPRTPHPHAKRVFAGGVTYEAVYITDAYRGDYKPIEPATTEDITPSPPEEVAGSDVAAAGPATAPDAEPVDPDETPFQRAMRLEGVVPDFDEPDADGDLIAAVDPCPVGDPECETGDDGSRHDGCTPAVGPDAAVFTICSIWPHDAHGDCPGVSDGAPRTASGYPLESDADALGVAATGPDEREWWIFSFGTGQPLYDRYVKMHGTCDGTREVMFRHFGREWSRQYRTDTDAARQIVATCVYLPRADWPAPIVATDPAELPEQCDKCETTGRNCLAHRRSDGAQ